MSAGAGDPAGDTTANRPTPGPARPRRRRPAAEPAPDPPRSVAYRQLRPPFPTVPVFTEDRVAAIHDQALRVLEDLGIAVLLPEARALYRAAGAVVDEDTGLVRLGGEIVAAALATAPRSIPVRAGARHRDLTLELGTLAIQSGAGAPHAHDRVRGRRPGTLQDFRALTTLVQAFDVPYQ
ncbi:MAG: trimethylamine methyltransferase family protein [Pseudomonadota bacterium]